MTGFVIGAPAVDSPLPAFFDPLPELWVPLRIRTPIDGAVYEPIQTMSQSIAGATTMNRKAILRRWNLNHAMVDHAGWVNLMAMFQRKPRVVSDTFGWDRHIQFGAVWFYDAAAPSTTPRALRGMTGWTDTTGGTSDGGISKRITAVAGRTYSWQHLVTPDVTKLLAVTEGEPLTVAFTAIDPDDGPGSTFALTPGVRWYTAAGTFLSASSTTKTIDYDPLDAPAVRRGRCTHVTTAPATAAYAQPTVTTTSIGVGITDPATGPIDLGPAWASVFIENLQTITHHHDAHQVTLNLREASAPHIPYFLLP